MKMNYPSEAGAVVTHAANSPPPVPGVGLDIVLSIPDDQISRRRWYVSVGASALLHLAVAGALLWNWSFARNEGASPPASMVVELAVMPASAPVPPTDVALGPKQIEAAPKPEPQEKTKFDPPPQVDPALSPSFALPVKREQTPVETPVVAKAARETFAPQAVDAAPVQDKNVAPVAGRNPAPPSDAEQSWEGRVLAELERKKRYPSAAQRASQQGTAFVRLVIDRRGRLLNATLKKSSGSDMLDAETMALVKRASPLPPPPSSIEGAQIVRVVPVEFYIQKH